MNSRYPVDINAARALFGGRPVDEHTAERLQGVAKAIAKGAGWNRHHRGSVPVAHEHHEAVVLGEWLSLRLDDYEWFHAASEGKRSERYGARLKAEGWKPGFPDYMIFKTPPAWPNLKGTALELKRYGATASSLSGEQRTWLDGLRGNGWLAIWAAGADEAISKLQAAGY